MPRRTQQERSASTQHSLLDAATALFAERGYDGVTLEEIVAAAGVSKGAVYHHYAGKRALFAAVFRRLAQQVRVVFEELLARYENPFEGIRALVDLYLDISLEPAARRIGMVDAPAVLGFEAWREVQFSTFLGLLVDELRAADARQPLGSSPELLASLLVAVAVEMSVQIAGADDPQAVRAEVEVVGRRVVDTLLPYPAGGDERRPAG